MPDVALRPLNTSLIRTTIEVDGQTLELHAIDADVAAQRVFELIDGKQPELQAMIAANLVEALATWAGAPGSDEELSEAKQALTTALTASLASAYQRAEPRRAVPPPPVITVSASPAPLPPSATIADARKWILTWEARSLDSADAVYTELSVEEPPIRVIEAAAFEHLLLRYSLTEDETLLQALATTPIDVATNAPRPIPTGPASGTAILDVTQSTGVRAVVVRNEGYSEPFIYTAEVRSEILAPTIDRNEEIVSTLAGIAAARPDRVEVWYESDDPPRRLPVLLVIEEFNPELVTAAIDQWRQMETPPDGELIFDVTAARLRLRRVVVR